MKTFMKWLGKKEKGQGMTEYIIIVAMIAVASIVILTVFGDQIRELFFASGQKIGGNSGYDAQNKMQGREGDVDQKLDDY